MSSISLIQPDRDLFSWPQYWAACFGPAPFLPMSREEMDQLGWDSCDIILVTGDAYVDHPSFGMAICGRMLEAQGFRVGIIAQPDWSSKDDFMRLGKPNLFFGVTAGNMDSMINRYTADRRLRHDDAYTPDNVAGKRPDRATLVYTQRCKEAWKDVPVILGGIEASLRRTAHYDYWSDTVRRSVLVDSKAVTVQPPRPKPWEKTYVLLPSFEKVKGDKVLYAHASRILHHETNPGCARALMQKHGDRYVWINPPAIPLSTEEMDSVFALPYKRVPHPAYGNARIPAYEMIRFSVNIMRGCFGGCSFCSITEHEGRIIQSRSEDSIINEIEAIRDTVPGFTGVISDLGGPTANMYMLRCKSPRAEQTCRRLSCVYPDICPHMDTNHEPTINLYRRARDLKGIKKILIASGVRYDIAVEDPRYIKELATHHVGGYLKIAPEHTEEGPLSKMMKPGMGSYDRFKELFDTYSKQAGKEQYLIPYFISAHPGTRDEDMVNLALWLKKHRFRLDQVQNFYPSPLANSTTMYYTGKNPLAKIGYKSEDVFVPKGDKQRRLHKALLRYHDPANWPLIRQALEAMGKKHLIGSRRDCLVPAPTIEEMREARRQNRNTRPALTKHTPMATQRQTPATAKKASSTQSRLQNAGAKKRPKAAVGR
ncbi:TPA: YgiQ family radical SAM protein [Escherichia coli]|nr:YgiQ family radical SAM protein [Escherichia coli]EFN5012909.1 YgiQ family radical SAM protein [Escherichia coli]EIX4150668.1 YgiQ family radical SAM protein [Escherichia coli]HAO9348475.1 YgiQ family radical SAM protein [Escherichia coli]HBP3760041.1 YgiQ family radical SAM protein [Escherichia coli]